MCGKCKHSTSSSAWSSSSSSSSCHVKRKKKCCEPKCCKPKCYKQKCCPTWCPQQYTCIRTRCGFYALMVTVTATPSTFGAAGEDINFNVVISNMGSEPIQGPITVQTDRLGAVTVNPGYLAPGGQYTSQALFTYTTTSADVTAGSVVVQTTATVQVDGCQVLSSLPYKTTVIYEAS